MHFNVVAAIDSERGIGLRGSIPWKVPEDLARFRDLTQKTDSEGKRNVVIMGRKTWQSLLPRFRPLPGRLNVVLSKSWKFCFPGAFICPSLEKAFEFSKKAEDIEEIFVIGGAVLYREALKHPLCRRVYLTRLGQKFGCDVFFPKIPDNFLPKSGTEVKWYQGLEYRFEEYHRNGGT